MDSKDYAKEFWSLANVVVGFSIVQTISFMITLGSAGSALAKAVASHRFEAAVAAQAGTVIYAALVIYFQTVHWRLDNVVEKPDVRRDLQILNGIRLAAVVFLGTVSFVAVVWGQPNS